MRWIRRALAAAVMLWLPMAWSSAALAQDRPLVAPTRDVIVTYELGGVSEQHGATRIKVTYADHSDRVRMDFFAFDEAVVPFASLIYDKPANHVLSLLPAKETYYEVPATGRANPGLFLSDKMHFERAGRETIAGLACNQWHVTNAETYDGTACVTDDGVVLRATRVKPTKNDLQAIAVEYQSPAASVFSPNPDMKLSPNDQKPH